MRKNRIFTVHLGCSKNQVDAECLVTEFLYQGFETANSAEEADYILINTCGFIEPAKEEAIETILSHLENKKEGQKIIVTGCLSQRYGNELKTELPEVDFWAGTYKPQELLKNMGIIKSSDCPIPVRKNLGGFTHHAYLKIAEGCDRQCAYCAIPGIRGRQVSRSIEDIVTEAKALEESGVKELTLIAQDTTYYG
ncbi:MAG: radical SAM protein, partial [Fibrobacteraceae bacterium]|nr:radical SAM protein [Fibrobacteraceae bacterium]